MKKGNTSFAFGKGQKRVNRLLVTTALTAASLMALVGPAYAVDEFETPIGESIADGAATFDRPELGQLDIHQSTDRVVIDWDTFNIGESASTQFYQPGTGSLAVNRVKGKNDNPTQILGSLKANGQVVVLDRNGVIFGKNSRLDVGGIIASTGDVDTAAVMSGSKIELGNFGDGAVVNNGLISVQNAGLAAFVGKNVANNGVINAKVGKVVLAAGDTKATVDLYGDGLVAFAVDGAKGKVLASNSGTINAEGGTVAITANAAKDVVDDVINMNGVVNVSSVTMQGGKIILGGGKSGTVKVSGKIKADGQGGGDVKVTGKNVIVTDVAELTANGGTIGNGGDIRVIGENAAIVHGTIKALGGSTGGDGGFVEVSGYDYLDFRIGNVDTRASYGAVGTLLIDPNDIQIIGGNGDGHDNGGAAGPGAIGGYQNTGDGGAYTTPTSDGASPYTIYESEIEGQSATTNIIIQARRNITTSAGTSADGVVTLAANRNLTIETQNNAGFNGSINLTNLGFQVQGTGTMNITAATGTVGTGDVRVGKLLADTGLITVSTDNGQIYLENGPITTNGGSVGFIASDRIFIDNDIFTNGGNITMEANRFTTDDTVPTGSPDNLDQLNSGGGNIRITANEVTLGNTGGAPAPGEVVLDAGNGSVLFERNTAGTIGLGGATGDTMLSDAELASIRARELFIGSPVEGNNKVTGIYVDSLDTTTNIIGKVTLSNYLNQTQGVVGSIMFGAGAIDNNNVHFFGGNSAFNALTVSANDHILVQNNVVVTSNGDVIFNADANAAGVGALVMGGGSKIDTNGNDFTYTGHQVLLGGAVIDAEGGDILLNNDDVFYTYSNDALVTSGTGTITLNQWDKNFTDPTGDWGNHDGSIQNAVNAVQNTGAGLNTIIAHEGTYNESVTVAENNFLIRSFLNYNVNPNTGVRGAETIVDPASPAFYIIGDNVEINGLEITGADENGIWIDGGENAKILNNIIHNIDGDGILAEFADGLVVKSNEIYNIRRLPVNQPDTGSGVQILNTAGATVGGVTDAEGNKIYDTAWDGVRVAENSSAVTVQKNDIDDVGRTGIYFGDTTDSFALGNWITKTGVRYGIDVERGANITLTGNDIDDTSRDGIHMVGVNGVNLVSGNYIDDTGLDGIDAKDVTGLSILNNFIGTSGVAFNINGDGILGTNVDGVIIQGNRITRTTSTDTDIGSGIQILETAGATIGGAGAARNTIWRTGWDGIRVEDSSDVVAENNDIDIVTRSGIYFGDSVRTSALGNFITNVKNRFGIHVDGGSDTTLTGNDIDDVLKEDGIQLNDVTGVNLVNENYVDNVFKANGINAIRVSGLSVLDNRIGTTVVANNIYGDGIHGEFVDGVIIQGNRITNTVSLVPDLGSGIQLLNTTGGLIGGPNAGDENTIWETAWDGIRLEDVDGVTVQRNDIDNVGRTGIYLGDTDLIQLLGNLINGTGTRFGIDVDGGSNVTITGNDIDRTKLDGINLKDVTGTNLINGGNYIDRTGKDGIHAVNVTGLSILNNFIGTSGVAFNIKGDGILGDNVDGVIIQGNRITRTTSTAQDIGSGVQILNTEGALVGGPTLAERNRIWNTGWDAVRVEDSNFIVVQNNDFDQLQRTGVYFGNTTFSSALGNLIDDAKTRYGVHVDGGSDATIIGNIINNVWARDGIRFDNGVTGVNLIEDNQVTDTGAGASGLITVGKDNLGTFIVSGNTFTDNDIGATFQSGLIDLTGDSNTFNNGIVGLRFAPVLGFSGNLTLVDVDGEPDTAAPITPPVFYAGTIGAQIFNDQSQYFVELLNGAFPNVWIDGRNSTYTIGATTVTPGLAPLSQADYDFLEPRFFDWEDDNSVGRFWFLEDLVEVNQQRIFNEFSPFEALGGQVNVVLLGLPRLGGVAGPTAFDPNAIEPAAGGDDTTTAAMSPEELNAIQTAAGDDTTSSNSSCWTDASSAALAGTTTFSFSSVINDTTLAQDASCGNNPAQ